MLFNGRVWKPAPAFTAEIIISLFYINQQKLTFVSLLYKLFFVLSGSCLREIKNENT